MQSDDSVAAASIAGDAPIENPSTGLALVAGEVTESDGQGIKSLLTRVLDRDIGEWRILGEASTNSLGNYEVPYNREQLQEWGKDRADLKVQVWDPLGDVLLVESPLILQARPHEVVNLVVGDERYRGPDEFARLTDALAGALPKSSGLRDLGVADVLILARQSGISGSKLGTYVKAVRWSAEYHASAELFFGLMRRGEPGRIDALFARPLPRLWERVQEAVARNLISVPLTDATRDRLAEVQQEYLARPEHPYAQLLGTTRLTKAQRAAFTRRLTMGGDVGDALWQVLVTEDGFGPQQVGEVRSAFEMRNVVGDNTGLTVRLRADLGVTSSQELARFGIDHWRDTVLATEVDIPDDVLPGATRAQRRAAYAERLYRMSELRHPTASLTGQLARHPAWSDTALHSFLEANRDLELRDQRMLTYLAEHSDAGDDLPAAARDDLLGLEQLFHLAPPADRLATISPLWDAGLRSAPQVAYLGRAQLARKTRQGLDPLVANRVYRTAVHITSLALNVYLRHSASLNAVSTTVLRRPKLPPSMPADEALAVTAVAMPEWEELFGTADACAVSPAQSATGQAAYLVDQLAFLERAVDDSGGNALDELLARRPDLGQLKLTSKNTESLVPAIDLANEVLEAIVASADGTTLPSGAIGETTWGDDLLAAQPEHHDPRADEILRQASYPVEALPFDVSAEETRRYLRQLGIERHDLMRAMPAQPGVDSLQIATEALAMTSVERDLITRPRRRPDEVGRAWGFADRAALVAADLSVVGHLLDRAHLDHDRLQRLLNTRYLNPGRHVAVKFDEGAPCSLDLAVLVGPDGAQLAGTSLWSFLDRLHRYLRLQRRLDCDEYDLDTLLNALGVTDLDAPGLILQLADAVSLRDDLGLDTAQVSTWWAVLDTHGFEATLPSRYEAVFLDDARFPDTFSGDGPDLRNAVFSLREDRGDLAITVTADPALSPWLAESNGAEPPAYTLQPDYAGYLQSATNLTADELLLLVRHVAPKEPATGHVPLTLATASLAFRFASLSTALAITMRDLIRLIALTGVSPLLESSGSPDSATPTSSRRFRDLATELTCGDFTVEQLAYLLMHEADAASALAPSPAEAAAWVGSAAPFMTAVVDLEEARADAAVTTAVSQSLAALLGSDATLLGNLLFDLRPGLGQEVLRHLIVAANPDSVGLPVPRQDVSVVVGQLHGFVLAWTGLHVDQQFLAFVLDQGPGLGWADLTTLPTSPIPAAASVERWRRLAAAASLQTTAFTTDQSLFGLLDDAATTDPGSFVVADFLAQISESTRWPLVDVTYLTGPDGYALDLQAAMHDERALLRLRDTFDVIRPRGVSAQQAHSWVIAEPSHAQAQSSRQALSLAYSPEAWLDVLGSIQDELRLLRRDALLGHALTSLGIGDADEFYRDYFIDPAVSTYDRTSRIQIAHSAVQAFAQRILLNLEPFHFERADAEGWTWRKRYRVWEAARTIFLYPHNWLAPELRDDKTPFFRRIEQGLMQTDVTHEAATSLYLDYLHDLHQVSQLEIMGLYCEQETAETAAVLHVFGRTLDVPHRNFYRRQLAGTQWTPWEPLDLDLSDHLVPVVSNGRLYLFWPELARSDNPNRREVETTLRVESDPARCTTLRGLIKANNQALQDLELMTSPNLDKAGNDPSADRDALEQENRAYQAELDSLIEKVTETTTVGPDYLVEITMRWSELREGRWSTPVSATGSLSHESDDSLARHYFTGWVAPDGSIRVSVRLNKVNNSEGVDVIRSSEGYVGYFSFDRCGAGLDSSPSLIADPVGEVDVTNSQPENHSVYWPDEYQSTAVFVPGAGTTNPPGRTAAALTDSPVAFVAMDALELQVGDVPDKRRLLTLSGHLYYAHQYGQYGSAESPFFVADRERTYFVRPEGFLAPTTTGAIGGSGLTAARDRQVNRQHGQGARAVTSSSPALGAAPHYGVADSALIIDHGAAASASGAMSSVIGSLSTTIGEAIAEDPPITVVAGQMSVDAMVDTRYRFTAFYHPHTCLLLEQAARYGVDGVLNPDPTSGTGSAALYRQLLPAHTFDFTETYRPDALLVIEDDPDQVAEGIDFDHGSPYGLYNWEAFFHIPVLVATRLMQHQRYDDARRWLHGIFDPTNADAGDSGPERYWKLKPFYLEQRDGPVESLQQLLTSGDTTYEQQVQAWERDPFNPFALARLRITTSMQAVVVQYLTCVIEQADRLFTRDQREDIDEARGLYLLAAEILGERPDLLEAADDASLTPDVMLARLRGNTAPTGSPGWVNPLEMIGALLPPLLSGVPSPHTSMRLSTEPAMGSLLDTSVADTDHLATTTTTTTTAAVGSGQEAASVTDTLLLFALPPDLALLAHWDVVADRLFKIRNSLTLSGQLRQLALYSPPIDPGLLVRAAAAGLNIDSVLSNLYAPPSHYRCSFLLQRAMELCGEVRGLGSALLGAMEKRDGEQVAQLRSTQEITILEAVRSSRGRAVEEAGATLAAAVRGRESAQHRLDYYTSRAWISGGEQSSLDALEEGRERQQTAELLETAANIVNLVPNVSVTFGATSSVSASFGGSFLGAATQSTASAFRARANKLTYESGKYAAMAGYDRRSDDWALQADVALDEIAQLDHQILAAEIRLQISETDLATHDTQQAHAREIDELLRSKFTNQELFSWLTSQLSAVHFQAYQRAYQLAVQAETAFHRELGPDEQSLTFIRPDNWDSLHSGLHAGDVLHQQLRQLEDAQLRANLRELEITKHLSVLQLDAAALLSLRQTGSCTFVIPELSFDLDFPRHYYRRIKAVRMSIPCVVGPYTSVSATLTRIDSRTRRSTSLSDPPEVDASAPAQTAIAVSSATQESGVFELNFGDPRYLPFEGAGAISTWQLDLPATLRHFDYATIADVILHLNYTARDGGQTFADEVTSSLPQALEDSPKSRLISMRQDRPNAWNQLYTVDAGAARTCALQLSKGDFPALLDYRWQEQSDGSLQAEPVTLMITALTAYLRPRGAEPGYADDVTLNQQNSTRLLALPSFDLSAADALSSQEISNDHAVECTLTFGALADMADWDDLLLLVAYKPLMT